MADAVISFPMFGSNFTLNPKNYITIFGHEIYWYGIIIAVGLIVAYIYMTRRSKDFGFKSDDVIDILLYAVPIGIVGARLYYVVFYFSQFKADTLGDTLYNIIAIWNGGLAIYGGVIFGIIGLYIYSKVKKKPLLRILDLASFGVIIGQIFGRWGNFFNREAYGATTTVLWKMGLTTAEGTIYVHPTFLYESLWNLIGMIIMHVVSKRHKKYDGQIFLLYLFWYGIGRYFIEGLRTDSLYLFGTGVRVSQLLGIVLFGISAILLARNARIGKVTPFLAVAAEVATPVVAVTEASDGTIDKTQEEAIINEATADTPQNAEVTENNKPFSYTDDDGYEYFNKDEK